MSLRFALALMLLGVSACDPIGGNFKAPNEGQVVVKKLSTMESGYSSSPTDWAAFLNCWSAQFGGGGAHAEESAGAMAMSELPPSYRHFVHATGGQGWQLPGAKSRSGHGYAKFLPFKTIGLLKKIDSATWKAWNDNRLSTRIGDRDYYDYSRKQDLSKFRDEHLDTLILVGDMGNGALVALNPAERSKDGEWEAWYLSTRLAGALRFRSFAELTQMLYFADLKPESDLWSYSGRELAASCAGKLRFS